MEKTADFQNNFRASCDEKVIRNNYDKNSSYSHRAKTEEPIDWPLGRKLEKEEIKIYPKFG